MNKGLIEPKIMEPQMNTDKHGLDFMEKLLDGVEVEWKSLGEVADE